MSAESTMAVEPISLCLGIVLCLFGWTLYRLSVNFLGVFGGGLLGWLLAVIIQALVAPDTPTPFWVNLLGIGLGAVVGALLFRMLSRYAFFILGAVIGGALAHLILMNAPQLRETVNFEHFDLVLYIALPIIFGCLFVFFQRSTMILLTSVTGVVLITLSISHWLMIFLAPAFLIGSVAAQMHLFRRSQMRRVAKAEKDAEAAKHDHEDDLKR